MTSSSKSVHFSSSTKRGRDEDTAHEQTKRVRLDDGADHHRNAMVSEVEMVEAKQKRRKRQIGVPADSAPAVTRIDETTSLAAEGVSVEPFHMKDEETDGDGYFDGDTFVFRRGGHRRDQDEEPDAWLEDWNEGSQTPRIATQPTSRTIEAKDTSLSSKSVRTRAALYSKILTLIGGKESVSQAIRRYGRVGMDSGTSYEATTAKQFLENLTGMASELLLQGDVNIYEMTRESLSQCLSSAAEVKSATPPPKVQWEYTGNQDGQIHGPFATSQMIAWTRAGYFVGAQKVRIRQVRQQELSTKDDLLSDLGEVNSDDGKGPAPRKHVVKGDWMWTNEVDFHVFG